MTATKHATRYLLTCLIAVTAAVTLIAPAVADSRPTSRQPADLEDLSEDWYGCQDEEFPYGVSRCLDDEVDTPWQVVVDCDEDPFVCDPPPPPVTCETHRRPTPVPTACAGVAPPPPVQEPTCDEPDDFPDEGESPPQSGGLTSASPIVIRGIFRLCFRLRKLKRATLGAPAVKARLRFWGRHFPLPRTRNVLPYWMGEFYWAIQEEIAPGVWRAVSSGTKTMGPSRRIPTVGGHRRQIKRLLNSAAKAERRVRLVVFGTQGKVLSESQTLLDVDYGVPAEGFIYGPWKLW